MFGFLLQFFCVFSFGKVKSYEFYEASESTGLVGTRGVFLFTEFSIGNPGHFSIFNVSVMNFNISVLPQSFSTN